MLSTKDLVFKEWLERKLVNQYISLYIIVFTSAIKLQLSTSMRIHLIVNISWIVQYKEQVEGQKNERSEICGGRRSWRIWSREILNERKVREIMKYLV